MNPKYKSITTKEEAETLVKEETARLQEVISTLTAEEVNMILRGERPLRIEYNDFRILRKSYQDRIKQYSKHKITNKK